MTTKIKGISMKLKEIIFDLWYKLRGDFPKETQCEYCGRFSPWYYKECPHESKNYMGDYGDSKR